MLFIWKLCRLNQLGAVAKLGRTTKSTWRLSIRRNVERAMEMATWDPGVAVRHEQLGATANGTFEHFSEVRSNW